jgi:hypothetical protein
MRRWTILLSATAIAVAMAMAACGGGGGSPRIDSGIRGTVMIGPACPVQRVGLDCADEPYATELRIVDPVSGKRVAEASSDASGHFEVALPPASYRLEPASSKSPPSAQPVDANVPPHHYVRVAIRFDSGIR